MLCSTIWTFPDKILFIKSKYVELRFVIFIICGYEWILFFMRAFITDNKRKENQPGAYPEIFRGGGSDSSREGPDFFLIHFRFLGGVQKNFSYKFQSQGGSGPPPGYAHGTNNDIISIL